jgi:hypothetical protein
MVPSASGGEGRIELVVMESVSPAYVPKISYKSAHAGVRAKAYADGGYPGLSGRGSAYAWKRQQWFDSCFARELCEEERCKRFGDRPGDLLPEDE